MKKQFLSIAIIALATTISCNSNTEKKEEITTISSDTSMVVKDNTMATNMDSMNAAKMAAENAMMKDSMNNAMAKKDNATKMAMAKPDPSKKGKKGKVSVQMATKGTGQMAADNEGYYANTEILPNYPGGQKALEKFFEDNLEYPQDATDNGVEGLVKLNFAVDENGKIYMPKIVSDNLGYGLEEETIRVFNKMPMWTPGKIKGKNVKTRFTLPVRYQLN
jgi:periplasmic protein TonB